MSRSLLNTSSGVETKKNICENLSHLWMTTRSLPSE